MTATEQVRDEAGVQALADAARAHRDEGAHVADASQRQACCSEHSKAAALSKKVVRRNSSTLSLSAAVTGSLAGCGMERYTLLSA